MTQSVLAVGDIHANWAALSSILAVCAPDVCLVCGDFGWWPAFDHPLPDRAVPGALLGRTEIRFCDGNHEDHPALLAAAPRGTFAAAELRPNIWYQPRGSTWDMPDGRRVLFAGGASSTDRMRRVPGESWFPEEVLERGHLPAKIPGADIVVAHTFPHAFSAERSPGWRRRGALWRAKADDPSRDALDAVLEESGASLWLCGHWHEAWRDRAGRTDLVVLNRADGPLPVRSGNCGSHLWLAGGPKEERRGWCLPDGRFLDADATGAGNVPDLLADELARTADGREERIACALEIWWRREFSRASAGKGRG